MDGPNPCHLWFRYRPIKYYTIVATKRDVPRTARAAAPPPHGGMARLSCVLMVPVALISRQVLSEYFRAS